SSLDTVWDAPHSAIRHRADDTQMGKRKGSSLHARAPIFYQSRAGGSGRFVLPGKILDPRYLGPAHPRIFVCDISFRLHGRYYIGNPKGQIRKQRYSVLLHRVVYEAVYGEIPEGFEVHHIDDNPFNNHPDNLEVLPRFSHRSSHKSEPRYVCTC